MTAAEMLTSLGASLDDIEQRVDAQLRLLPMLSAMPLKRLHEGFQESRQLTDQNQDVLATLTALSDSGAITASVLVAAEQVLDRLWSVAGNLKLLLFAYDVALDDKGAPPARQA